MRVGSQETGDVKHTKPMSEVPDIQADYARIWAS